MTTTKIIITVLILLACRDAASAQAVRQDATPASAAPAVTLSLSAKGVRVAAIGSVRQLRLEVFGRGTDSLYSSGFQPGSVHDWALDDGHGQRLADGTYLCVITIRDLSGRLSVRQGSIVVQGEQASLQLGEAETAPIEPDKELIPVASDGVAAVTLTAHDGRDGQVVSTRGGLSFRAGDFFGGKEKELMRLTPEGDVGLGVASPTAKLDVAGIIHARGGIQFDDGTVLTSAGRRPNSTPGSSANAAGDVTTAAVSGSGTANKLAKWLDGSGSLGDSVVTESGGFLGVGTATPSTPLDVVYNDNNFGFGVNLRNTNTGPLALVGYGINNASGGRVGQFVYVPPGYVDASLRDSILFSSVGPTAKLGFVSSAEGGGAPDIFIRAGGAKANSIYVQGSTGNVGVGTSAPLARLDVSGNLKVSGNADVAGNIAAKYQDVAEWVPSRERLAAGTVVVLDPTRANAVMSSTRAYDSHVAGVVSSLPGVILGQAGEDKVMVATTGRVKVRVDATRGRVRIGDLLVTSGRPGVAMRSRPVRVGRARLHRPGTILGKALEPLAGGEGEILVLLSLQ